MGWEEGVGCVGGQWIGGTSVVVMLGGTVTVGSVGWWRAMVEGGQEVGRRCW